MDHEKYRITLKEVGFEENTGTRNDGIKNPLCLNKQYRILTHAGERVLTIVFDLRNHENNEITIYLYNEHSSQYINAELVKNLEEVNKIIMMAQSESVSVVYGN